jgi:hypothetical protein
LIVQKTSVTSGTLFSNGDERRSIIADMPHLPRTSLCQSLQTMNAPT